MEIAPKLYRGYNSVADYKQGTEKTPFNFFKCGGKMKIYKKRIK